MKSLTSNLLYEIFIVRLNFLKKQKFKTVVIFAMFSKGLSFSYNKKTLRKSFGKYFEILSYVICAFLSKGYRCVSERNIEILVILFLISLIRIFIRM